MAWRVIILLGWVMGVAAGEFVVAVSNERGGTVSFVDPKTRAVETIAVGKRPRGIHAYGNFLYVAVSGSPIGGPAQLDAQGNPVLKADDDEDEKNSDHSADGIAVVDISARKFLKKLPAGSDPEQFAVSADGKYLYVANEDVGTASVLNIATEKVERILKVKKEPEGVALSPDGAALYVTCETGGEVFVFATKDFKQLAEIKVGGRPRNVAFSGDGKFAYVPSESFGVVHVVYTSQFEVSSKIQLPTGSRPMGIVMSKAGKLYATTGRGGAICVIDPKANGDANAKLIKVGARPWGIGLSPDEKIAFVANGPSNDISIVDLEKEAEVGRVKVGEGPWGIAVLK